MLSRMSLASPFFDVKVERRIRISRFTARIVFTRGFFSASSPAVVTARDTFSERILQFSFVSRKNKLVSIILLVNGQQIAVNVSKLSHKSGSNGFASGNIGLENVEN